MRSTYGFLINYKGMCYGFATLAELVLNQVGIPTLVVQNEEHAWNIITLNDNKYHADITWGSGMTLERNYPMDVAIK